MKTMIALLLAALAGLAACTPYPPGPPYYPGPPPPGAYPPPPPPPISRPPVAGIGQACGGHTGAVCGGGAYCEFAPGSCGMDSRPGRCAVPPQACTQQYAPVCGCDGRTYGNACTAAGNGVSMRHAGECGGGGVIRPF